MRLQFLYTLRPPEGNQKVLLKFWLKNAGDRVGASGASWPCVSSEDEALGVR